MKIKHVLATLTFSMAAGFAAFGLANHQGKVAEETKAEVSTTLAVGSTLYIDDSTSNWSADNYMIGIWNHGGDVVNVATYDETSGYFKITISAACQSFNLIRASSLTEGQTTWPSPTNQSDNVSVVEGKNVVVGNGYDNSTMTVKEWSVYDKGITPTGTVHESVFYAKVPNEKCDYYVYTAENVELTVDGVNILAQQELMGSWNTYKLTPTTKTYYNPADLTSSENSYGILEVPFKYYDINNTIVIINAVQTVGGSYTFQTKNLVVGASADNELELKVGAYYYGTNDWNLWDGFGYDADNYADMGYDAALAYELGTTDLCNINKKDADDLRDRMDTKKDYLGNSTQWDSNGTYYYSDIYAQVNSKCTNPYSLSNTIFSLNSDNSSALIITLVSAVSLIAVASFFMLKKKKESK